MDFKDVSALERTFVPPKCKNVVQIDGDLTLNAGKRENKNSSGDEIANVNFFYNIAHVEASAYAHLTSS